MHLNQRITAYLARMQVRARRPNYEIGTKAPLSLKRPGAAPAAPPAPAANTWQLSNQDDEMLDDEDLLTEEDKTRPEVPAAGVWSGQLTWTGLKKCNNSVFCIDALVGWIQEPNVCARGCLSRQACVQPALCQALPTSPLRLMSLFMVPFALQATAAPLARHARTARAGARRRRQQESGSSSPKRCLTTPSPHVAM